MDQEINNLNSSMDQEVNNLNNSLYKEINNLINKITLVILKISEQPLHPFINFKLNRKYIHEDFYILLNLIDITIIHTEVKIIEIIITIINMVLKACNIIIIAILTLIVNYKN